jgi:hypothetical protein
VPGWNLKNNLPANMDKGAELVPLERVQNFIFMIRRKKVTFDSHLAGLYGVETTAAAPRP